MYIDPIPFYKIETFIDQCRGRPTISFENRYPQVQTHSQMADSTYLANKLNARYLLKKPSLPLYWLNKGN